MYADNKHKSLTKSINDENPSWQTIQIKDIPVRGGKVEVGFRADGKADAFCYVDDVSLLKSK